MATAVILTSLFALLLFFIFTTLATPLAELAGEAPAMIERTIEHVTARILGAVLPALLAQAWDEGRRIGLTQADYEYGHRLTMPNLTNPYRQEA